MTLKIVLENYQGAINAGQSVVGNVLCNFHNDTIQGLKIKYLGRAETKWIESEKYYDEERKEERTQDVEHRDEEIYFSSEQLLYQGGQNLYGEQNYSFMFSLPHQLPSSFEGTYGNIRYTVTASIVKAYAKNDEDTVRLNVLVPLNLNLLSHLKEPAARSVDSTPCSCWCQNSGPITFDMSVPVTGYTLGEYVNIGAHIENMSNINVECVKFKLTQNIYYKIRTPSKSKEEQSELGRTVDGAIGAHGDKAWTTSLQISTNQPFNNFRNCSLIKADYYLKGKAVLPCPHSDLLDFIELTIGSVPLTNVAATIPQHTYNPSAPTLDTTDVALDFTDIEAPAYSPNPTLGWNISNKVANDLPSYDEAVRSTT